ncbi:PSF3 DNA replication complex GINS protein PSF3 [Candida maltosa Xu316]
MPQDYYNLDDILAENEKIPCKFSVTVPGLGYLEGNPGKPILEDTKIELPYWLAHILGTLEISDTHMVELGDPDFINKKVINAIKSDPSSLDLHKLTPYFYLMVLKWGSLYDDEVLIENIMNCLKSRSLEIYNFSSNANKTLNNEFLYTLDEFEKSLFKSTSESNKLMRQWFKKISK